MFKQADRRRGVDANGRTTGSINSRLLEADFFATVAQVVHMVEIDAGNDRDVGIEYVHGIEPPAKAHLKNGHIDASIDEPGHRAQCAEFEVGQRNVVACRVDPFEGSDEFSVACLPAGDPHAFVVAQQMRRGVEAGLVAGGIEDGSQVRTGRAFAVGTADDDERKIRNQAKRVLDPTHPVEAEIDRTGM